MRLLIRPAENEDLSIGIHRWMWSGERGSAKLRRCDYWYFSLFLVIWRRGTWNRGAHNNNGSSTGSNFFSSEIFLAPKTTLSSPHKSSGTKFSISGIRRGCNLQGIYWPDLLLAVQLPRASSPALKARMVLRGQKVHQPIGWSTCTIFLPGSTLPPFWNLSEFINFMRGVA